MARGSKASRGIYQNIRPFNLRQNTSGMAQNRAESFLRPDQAVDIVNMHSTEEGSWSADMVGYTKINNGGNAYEGGARVDGLAWYVDEDNADHLIMAINGKLKEINTGTGADAELDGAAGYGGQVDFIQMNYNLYSTDGTINPRKWDGAAGSAAAGWPVSQGGTAQYSKPKFCDTHQDRAVFLNFQEGVADNGDPTKYPSHFIISDLQDPETFTFTNTPPDGAYLGQAGVGDGQEIVGSASMHIPATNESQLVIFKTRSTYTVIGDTPADGNTFSIVKMNGSYGAINNRCIIPVGNDILALNEFGVTSFSSTTDSGTIQPNPINSDLVKDVVGRLNLDFKDQCWGQHIPERREVIFWLPTGASQVCNEAIVYKYPSPGAVDQVPKWSRRKDSGEKFLLAHGVLLNRTFYVGTYGGVVGTMFTSSKYDDVGIPYKYEYPYWDAGNDRQIKRCLSNNLLFKLRSSQNITLLTQWRGGGNNDVDTETRTIGTTVAGAVYGVAVYGAAYYGAQEEIKEAFSPKGNGGKMKCTISGTTSETGPEFLGMSPLLEMGNLSQHWN